ncbi:SMI1/KNR4 family protein [Streptomyces sp. NPDC020983]|uniref:SMI1/KNR4 family protein n=1 Tax=Streptomyces sp. NPDC020983 TaxID=3365106 RepID=UPI0037A348BE
MATLDEIKGLLGEPCFHWSDPAPWVRLEQELGVVFPEDFREITDAYGPVLISGKLYLYHPGHSIRSLGEEIKESLEFWREEGSADILPREAGARPGELLPIATGATAETVFLEVPNESAAPWAVGVQELDTGEYVPYDMAFSDWLLAFLKGEDVMAGSSLPDHPSYEFLN